MQSTHYQSVADNFQQIKTESSTRTQRIKAIWQSAFGQVSQEFKAGYKTVRPLATDLSSTVVADLKQRTSQASTQLQDAWQTESAQTNKGRRWHRVMAVVATSLAKVVGPPLKKQADRVDVTFTEWYGKPYLAVKQGLQPLGQWCYQQIWKPTSADVSAVASDSLTVLSSEPVTVDITATSMESTAE